MELPISPQTCTQELPTLMTSVMIYHRGASLSEQHNDLLCTTAKTATLSVTTYA